MHSLRDSKSSALVGQTIVITGASSGIGRATASAFARRGANLVLAARREHALEQTAAECGAVGGRAIVVPTDVTDEAAMGALARRAVEEFGRLDVWINNAGTGLFGPFAAAEPRAHRRVVETNLFGAMHGAAAALPVFLKQRRGVLITNISIGGFVPVPFAAAYTASKFALRGFMASLRQELARVPGIRVCSVFPSTVDTPGFAHGANVSGRALRPGGPILAPEEVAEVLVSVAARPRDEVSVGWPTTPARLAYGLAPLLTERVAGVVFRHYAGSGRPARRTLGNLFEPVREGATAGGGWKKPSRPAASSTLFPAAREVLVGGLAVAGAALLATWVGRGRGLRQT